MTEDCYRSLPWMPGELHTGEFLQQFHCLSVEFLQLLISDLPGAAELGQHQLAIAFQPHNFARCPVTEQFQKMTEGINQRLIFGLVVCHPAGVLDRVPDPTSCRAIEQVAAITLARVADGATIE